MKKISIHINYLHILFKLVVILISFCVFNNSVSAGNLSSLDVVGYEGELSPTFDSNTYEYDIEIYGSEIDLDFSYEKENSADEVTITGNIYIKNETGLVTINVGGTEYKINYSKTKIPTGAINATTLRYTGGVQKFKPSKSGYYKVELWGASGGSDSSYSGKGAYTRGYIVLSSNNEYYVFVGSSSNGYNGGGTGASNASNGGGATDLRLVNGNWNNSQSLASRIMVAAGGGGWETWGGMRKGGSGGIFTGENGVGDSYPYGATQISGGLGYSSASKNGGFGYGGPAENYGGGGGSGYYGGGGGTNSATGNSGAGGTSYVSGYKGCVAVKSDNDLSPRKDSSEINDCTTSSAQTDIVCSYHYSGRKFSDPSIIDGNSVMPNIAGNGTMTGNLGDGAAKFTLMGDASKDNYLSSLTSNKGTWNKEFNVTDYEYEVSIGTNEEYITINAISSDEDAEIYGTGEYKINYKYGTTINITVMSPSGDIRIYNINVTRERYNSSTHTSKLVYLSINKYDDVLDPLFNENTHDYSLDIYDDDLYLDIDTMAYDPEATVSVVGNERINSSGTVTITVSEPHVAQTTYRINYTKHDVTIENKEYSYTGTVQSFVAPVTGIYNVELWGASGGTDATYSGRGAYTSGKIILKQGQEYYIYIGDSNGVFNGGGSGSNGSNGYNGGGATDFRLVNGDWRDKESLVSRIMVAAGGGGWEEYRERRKGGSGGLNGENGVGDTLPTGGSQAEGGIGTNNIASQNGGFGFAGNGSNYGGGGGSGYYGGGAGANSPSGNSGAGGSSFVSGYLGCLAIKSDIELTPRLNDNGEICSSDIYNPNYYGRDITCSYHYSGYIFDDSQVISGNENVPTFNGTSTMKGNLGNGHAKITFIASASKNNYLTSLETDGKVLVPSFDPYVKDYEVSIDKYSSGITINAEAEDEKSVISGLGRYNLEPGETKNIKIIVTAEDGSIRIYNINATRGTVQSGEHTTKLKNLSILNELTTLNPEFDSNTLNYNIEIIETDINIDLDYEKYDSNANVTITGNKLVTSNSGVVTITVTEPHSQDTVYKINYLKKTFVGNEKSFNFTGGIQDYYIPEDGYYKIELWGAQGGTYNSTYFGGYGGYSTGISKFNKNDYLNIAIGGTTSSLTGGYNGGGTGIASSTNFYSYGGGGATHISTEYGTLASFENRKNKVLIVAGGGGGSLYEIWGGSTYAGEGGSGGGFVGNSGGYTVTNQPGTGGTQTEGGSPGDPDRGYKGTFGAGGNGVAYSSAGGGGYYGGGASNDSGGGGGSGYIGSDKLLSTYLSKKHMYCYNCITSVDADTYTESDGVYSCHNSTPTSDCAKEGNGYAKIQQVPAPSDNNYLLSLTSDAGSFNKTFNPLDENYSLTLDKYQRKVKFEVIKSNESATVFGADEYYEINVNETKDVSISVISESGKVKVYTIKITRQGLQPGEHSSKLANINLYQQFLDQEFNPLITSYTMSLPKSDLDINIEAVPFDSEAQVNIVGHQHIKETTGTVTITVSAPTVEDTIYTINFVRYNVNPIYEYDTAGEYTFIAPSNGIYKFELWGASGGGSFDYHGTKYQGGFGGYSTGEIQLYKDDIIYINVGGTTTSASGGYNGGGNGTGVTSERSYMGGGGATHIALESGILSTFRNKSDKLLMAAGGGGGTSYYYYSGHVTLYSGNGGSGGGIFGTNGTSTNGTTFGYGGTQLSGGNPGSFGNAKLGLFGKGGDGIADSAGGGGGYYGGGAGNNAGAGGGSGYIANKLLSGRKMVIYSTDPKNSSTDEDTYTEITTNVSEEPISEYAKKGSGYARILADTKNKNNYLTMIQTDVGDWDRLFDTDVYEYTITLNDLQYKINVEARPEKDQVEITGTGEYDIPADINNDPQGPTNIPIVVTAEAGNVKVYTLHIKRPANSISTPKNITISGLIPSYCNKKEVYCKQDPIKFNKNTNNYDMTIPYKIKELYFNVEKDHPYQEISGEGKVTVTPYDNEFTVSITSEDGLSSSVYNYSIYRDMTGDADISVLHILNPVIDINFDPDITEYYFSVGNEIDKFKINDLDEIDKNNLDTIQLYYELDDANATSYVLGDTNLKAGQNIIEIAVKAANGEVQTYNFNIYRELDNTIYLNDITVSDLEDTKEYDLIPSFNKIYTGTYKAIVEKDVESIKLDATAEKETTTVSGVGNKNLNKGDNIFTVTTTAQNGNVENYKVNIFRQRDDNANISSLELYVDGHLCQLDKEFDSEIQEYSTAAEIRSDEVEFIVNLESNLATYKLLDNNKLNAGANIKKIAVTAEDKTTKIYTFVINRKKENDKTLKELQVTNSNTEFILNPVFDSTEKNYTLAVENSVSSVNVQGVSNSDLSQVIGNGTYNLSVGNNEVRIKVRSEKGEEDTYKITITRAPNSNPNLSNITTDQGVLITTGQRLYSLNVSSDVKIINVTGIPEVNTTTVMGNGVHELKKGDNIITLTTLAEDKVSTLTYTIIVTRDKSNNTNLSDIFVREGIITPDFSTNIISYTVRVPNNVDNVHVDYVKENEDQTVEVLNNTNLSVGDNEVIVKVTAEDETYKEYKINVIRQEQEENSNSLSSLTLSDGTLTPAFNKDKLYYEVTVPKTVSSINVSGTLEDTNATVTGLGNYNLNVGQNLVKVKVLSTDNKERDYQIKITRLKSDEARISSLTIRDINVNFDKDTYSYNVSTKKNNLDFTNITMFDNTARYEIEGNNFTDIGNYQVKIKTLAENESSSKEYVFNVNRLTSDNNNLSSLSVEGYTLDRAFDKNVTNYSLTTKVNSDINNINIIAKTEDKNATIDGDGIRSIEIFDNYINVVVTSEDNTPKTYTINVYRKGSSNTSIKLLEVLNGEINTPYNDNTSSYNVTIPYEEDHFELNVVLDDVNATYNLVNNASLRVGNNTVNLVVTSEEGDLRTITFNVLREDPISALLQNLTVENYELLEPFDMNNFRYNLVVYNEIESINVIATPLDSRATYEVVGNTNLVVGNNEVEVNVTSRDGNIHETYIINVRRQEYTNNFLSSLTTNIQATNEEFNKFSYNYTIDVDSTTDEIEILATPEDENAVVIGIGTKELVEGPNNFTIRVKKDGLTRYYYLTINKNDNSDNYLLSLSASANGNSLEITPQFDSKKYNYEIVVPASTESINLSGTASDGAVVTGLSNHNINLGNNNIEITVTSENNRSRKYYVKVTRPVSINANVISISPSSGTLSPTFSNDVYGYTLNLGSNINKLSFNVQTADKFATVDGNEELDISVGESQRIITVTAEDGRTSKQFTININKANPDNAFLTNLYINGYNFEENFQQDVYEYHVTVPNEKTSLMSTEVVASLSDQNATIEKENQIDLSTKVINEYDVVVKSYDKSVTKTYKIYINRLKSSFTQLDQLSSDKGRFRQIFNPTIKEYDLDVYEDEEDVTFSGTPSNEDIQIISGIGKIDLEQDEIEHKILMTAENGDVGFYKINIHRSIKTTPGLVNLGLNHSDDIEYDSSEFVLDKEFDTDVLSYSISVPYEYKILDVYYEKNEQQTVKVKVAGRYVEDYELSNRPTDVEIEVYDGFDVLTRTYTLKVTRNKSRNSYLKALSIADYELTPEFDKHTQEYYIRIEETVNNLEFEDIIAVPENEDAIIDINGYRYLIEGYNDLTIEVMAQDGSTRTYVVHVIKGEDKASNLKNITVSTGEFFELSPEFDPNIYDYTTVVPNIYNKVTVEGVVEDSDLVSVTGNGEYNIVLGNNPITIIGTAIETGQISVYTVNVIKEPDYDVDLVHLSAAEGTLSPSFERLTNKYSMNVDNNVEKLTLDYRTSARTAKTYVIGNDNFISGENKVSVVVTNFEGTKSKTYQIIVNKDKSSNAILDEITVTNNDTTYELEQSATDSNSYYTTVPADIESVSINVKPEEKTTNILGDGIVYLEYGDNQYMITSIAEDGTTMYYYVNIKREYNVNLSELICYESSLTPTFNENVTDYTVNVGMGIDKINLIGIPVSDLVEVTKIEDYPLARGENNITINVIAPDNTSKQYHIKVNRALDDNNYIRDLQVNSNMEPGFNKLVQDYELNVEPDKSSLDFNITLDSDYASYEIIGNNNLSANNNPNRIIVRVTAEDNSTRDYIFNTYIRDENYFTNTLKSISINEGQLTPDFNSNINNYAVTVENSISEIVVSVEKQDEGQKVAINGTYSLEENVALNVGRNTVLIPVVSASGNNTSLYTLVVYRKANVDATLKSLVVEGQDLDPIFTKNNEDYNLTIESEIKNLNITAIPTDKNSKVEITGNKNIPNGESQIKIKVTAYDNLTTKEYRINVNKPISTNNYLKDLFVVNKEFNETFNKENKGPYTLNVDNNVTSILVRATPEVSTTTVSGAGIIYLNKGWNIINVVSTSESGDARVYTIMVNRAYSSNNLLSDIIISEGKLSPEFDSQTKVYNVEVDDLIEEISVTGIPQDPNATVDGNNTYDLTKYKETNITLTVYAEDQSSTTYNIKVTRNVRTSSYLSELSIKEGMLNPEFNKLITNYNILVPNEVTSLTMNYLPEDSEASVTVLGNSNFKVGNNKVYIRVTSKDEEYITTYELNVIRQNKASNFLSNLEINNIDNSNKYVLNPTFNKNTIYYEVNVPTSVDKVNILAELEDELSIIDENELGIKDIEIGTNRFYINVKSPSGIIRTYSVVVNRLSPQPIDISNIDLKTNGAIDYTINMEDNKTTYELTVPYDYDRFDNVVVNSDNNYVSYKYYLNDNLNSNTSYNLKIGLNILKVEVYNEFNELAMTYNLNITREENTYLSTIVYTTKGKDDEESKSHYVTPFDKNTTHYEVEVENDISKVDVIALAEDLVNAKIAGSGIHNLNVGDNLIELTVRNKTYTRSYTLNIIRKPSSNTNLKYLRSETGQISPEFTNDNDSYDMSVLAGTNHLDLSYEAEDETTTITSITDITEIDNEGHSHAYVTVQAQDGTTRIITINVTFEPLLITSDIYNIRRNLDDYDDYVTRIELKTSIEDFVENFNNDKFFLHVYDKEDNEITDKTKSVGTGMKLKLEIDDVIYDTLDIVVLGDIDGDGKCVSADYRSVNLHILKSQLLTGTKFLAADIDENGSIQSADYRNINRYILKLTDSFISDDSNG